MSTTTYMQQNIYEQRFNKTAGIWTFAELQNRVTPHHTELYTCPHSKRDGNYGVNVIFSLL
jgi:hypothetical protein